MSDQPSIEDTRLRGSGAAAGDGQSEGLKGATGQELRERREALGVGLSEIADSLHIRVEYLEALEYGDYDALPSSVYAVGFVRSYAKHLGMDSDKAAVEFRMEIAGERPTARLHFPEPLTESRIPTGAIVLVTALLAVAIYGIWYYLSARDLNWSDIIPMVPAELAGERKQPLGPVASGQTGKQEKSPSATVGDAPKPATPSAAESSVSRPETSAAGIGTAGIGTAGIGTAGIGTTETGTTGTGTGSQAGPAAGLEQRPPVDTVSTGENVVAEAPPSSPSSPSPTTPPVSTPSASTSSELALAPSGGAVPATGPPAPPKSRIELRAIADSWIQVKNAAGAVLATRILGRGESYKVPPEVGLRLTTGNAGGLEILVDGVPIPPIGPFGAVRRDVALDPDILKAGNAMVR